MDGKEIYKYAVTETIKNIKELIQNSKLTMEEIKYIIPHQSNLKIMKSIANKLKIDNKKVYTNIENVGNTFCASIPIALDEMFEKHLLKKGDKVNIKYYYQVEYIDTVDRINKIDYKMLLLSVILYAIDQLSKIIVVKNIPIWTLPTSENR